MGVLCGFCSGCCIHIILWDQKKMQFGIEIRDYGALPKPTLGIVLGLGAQPMGGKQKGRLLHGVNFTWGYTSLIPGHGAEQPRGQLHHMLPML